MKGTKTEKNLLKAFAGESQARGRYEFFSKIAKKEGYEQIAAIFQETADNELSHSKNFFKFLESGEPLEITATYPAGRLGTTLENLKNSAAGEMEEWESLYPEYAKIAIEEGFTKVAAFFINIGKVEKEHGRRFAQLAELIESDMVFKRDEVVRWKCRKCGYIHEGKHAPSVCPACLHPQGYFEVDQSII